LAYEAQLIPFEPPGSDLDRYEKINSANLEQLINWWYLDEPAGWASPTHLFLDIGIEMFELRAQYPEERLLTNDD
jgi:hypothetical protein